MVVLCIQTISLEKGLKKATKHKQRGQKEIHFVNPFLIILYSTLTYKSLPYFIK